MTERDPKHVTGWIGPLFRWELIQLARRGQAVRARSLLAGIVLIALMFFTVYWFADQGVAAVFRGTAKGISIQESANFGDRFATTFLLSQLVVMIFLTPAYAAGGIAEERERKTFDFLIVSSLSSREIVVGKFLGRVVFLLGVLFAGLPILSLTLLYGGVDLGIVLSTYLLTAGTVAVISAASFYAALSADSYRSAMFRAYALTVLFALIGFGCFYISPLFIFVLLQTLREETVPFILLAVGYPLIEWLIVWFLLALAIKRIRTVAAASNPDHYRNNEKSSEEGHSKPKKAIIARVVHEQPLILEELDSPPAVEPIAVESAAHDSITRPIARPVAKPPDERPIAKVIARKRVEHEVRDEWQRVPANHPPVSEEDPFFWKEYYCSLHRATSDEDSLTGLKISAAIMLAFVFAIVGLIGFGSAAAGKGGEILFCTATFGCLLHLIFIGSDACGRIALERTRLTLETLLSLPVDRKEMLFAKWRTSAYRGYTWGTICAIIGPACMMGSSLGTVGLPILIYQLLLIPLSAVIGLYLSMRCQSTARAMLFFLPIIGVCIVAPAVIYFGFSEQTLFTQLMAWGLMVGGIVGMTILWIKLNREFDRDGGGFDGAR